MSYYGSRSSGGGNVAAVIALVIMGIVFLFSFGRSCSEQSITRSWGGEMDMELEPNQKLVNVTWKENSLWILTKDMKEDDVAETYTFYEKDTTGWLEGAVHIKEVKMSEEELKALEAKRKEQETLAIDYSNYSNFGYDEETEESINIFIVYDADKDEYTKIKEYTYGKDGELIPIE